MGATTALGAALVSELRDRFDRRSPLPRRAAQIDAGYLSRLLGTRIEAVERLDVTAGTTDRARLRLHGADSSLPATAFVKTAPTAAGPRLFTRLAGLGRNECGFYRAVRPGLRIETPEVLGIDHDPRLERFTIVIEDLTARAARFTDAAADMSPADAALVVRTLAGLHATHWDSPRLTDTRAGGLGWITTGARDPMLPLIRRAMAGSARLLARRQPELLPRAGERILRRFGAVTAELDAGPHTVLHGDPHPGNVYFTDAAAGLLDWQVLRRGDGIRDLTYFLVFALSTEDRLAHTPELLAVYLEELARRGGPRQHPADVRRRLRAHAAYAYASIAFTAVFAGLQSDTIARSGLRKAARAVEDLDTAAALACLAP
ncbi:ecdysteroid 22-kinase family protein [Nocardia yamanashiensis]|uniref:ecdysteroid 22-kinase family protein n=1 Tax=Nocardia yamanashiensis TaxID=209247 RepID=UPI001E32F07A|nr:ecdysteroid 22-kinase family protein [Nocardia yamanashiensis]UGT40207.1 ecdysteroid 22-kinase family protein [Nocardia yamanashiensis]